MDEGSRVLKKKSSVWRRRVKVDLKPLFLAAGKATAHALALKPEELAADATQAVAALGLDVPAEERGFVLIQRALLSAMIALTQESRSYLGSATESWDSLSADVEAALDGVRLEIGESFIKNPGKLKLLSTIQPIFAQWLCDRGVAPSSGEVISRRLPAYFVYGLAKEWRKNSSQYQELLLLEKSPFMEAEEYERGWQTYFAYLNKRINENVFDEPFSLAQIYVPLNASCVTSPEGGAADERFSKRSSRAVVDAQQELLDWLRAGNKNDAVRVISGGPGSGKSSFTRMLCAHLANSGVARPLYIPLHLVDPTRDVASEVERFSRDEGLLGFNPLDSARAEDGLVLVFDGLDELASQGKVGAQVTRDFVQAVERMVERRNLGQHPVFVILSGRELVIQENETEFRKPRQILSLLPYYFQEHDRRDYKDDRRLLLRDLRDEWWRKYGALTGQGYSGIPDSLRKAEIGEVTAQPLLNYLVALSYKRGKLNFAGTVDLNRVYGDLVAAVHERGYESRRTYGPIRHINLRDFVRVLEEIALAAWHGSDGRSTSVRSIVEHCQQSGISGLLDSFKDGAEAGVTKLLAAFFFRRSGDNAGDDAAFVFTHKSFGEYLTASRITRGIERIALERSRRIADADDGVDVADALITWARLTGPAPMTEYVQGFLRREIAARPKSEVAAWQNVFTELASKAIEDAVPIEKLALGAFALSAFYEANASSSLLVALNACARATNTASKLNLSSTNAFGSFLRRVVPQRVGPGNPPLYSALSHLDLTDQCLDMVDLYGADLTRSVFNKVSAHFGNFAQAKIHDTRFLEATLDWSRFDNCGMSGADFSRAHLGEVNFRSVELSDCKFDRSIVVRPEFQRARIKSCTFRRARLYDGSLDRIDGIADSNFDKAIVFAEDAQWIESKKQLGEASGTLRVIRRPKADAAHELEAAAEHPEEDDERDEAE